MNINIPTKIIFYGLTQYIYYISANHCHMMFKAVLANKLHKFLQIVHFGDSYTSIHTIWIICKLSLSEITLYTAERIIRRNAELCKISFSAFSIHSTECINLTQGSAKNAKRSKLKVVINKTLREVSTVSTYTFITVFSKVVIPI